MILLEPRRLAQRKSKPSRAQLRLPVPKPHKIRLHISGIPRRLPKRVIDKILGTPDTIGNKPNFAKFYFGKEYVHGAVRTQEGYGRLVHLSFLEHKGAIRDYYYNLSGKLVAVNIHGQVVSIV